MAGTCGASFAKFVLIFFNILFFCAGIVLICVGGWIVGSPEVATPLQLVEGAFGRDFLRNAGILLITMGVLVVLVTALGLYAAASENVIALSVFLALLVVILFGLISGGVVAIVFKDKILENLSKWLTDSLGKIPRSYYNKTSTGDCASYDPAHAWDYIQDTFECCGVNGTDDYDSINSSFAINIQQCNITENLASKIPVSCCRKTFPGVQLDTVLSKYNRRYDCSGRNVQGCTDGMEYFVQKYAPVLIGIGLGFGFLQLFGIIFTVCLCQNPVV